MKKLAIVKKHYQTMEENKKSIPLLRKLLTKKFIRTVLKTRFGDENFGAFMCKRWPVINTQEMIDHVWNVSDENQKRCMLILGNTLTHLPSIELLDRDWDSIKIDKSSEFFTETKENFQRATGYLPFEERIDSKDW